MNDLLQHHSESSKYLWQCGMHFDGSTHLSTPAFTPSTEHFGVWCMHIHVLFITTTIIIIIKGFTKDIN